MQYAIELYFDKETERRLFELIRLVSDKGLSTKYLEWKTRPHVTLACFSDVDEAKCAAALEEFARCHKPMPAYIGSIGMFTDTRTIFASPIMSEGMYQMQRELHKCMSGFDTKGWEWYLPGIWVPHCGLALMSEDDKENFYKASELLVRNFEKINGMFASIGLVKISFPVDELFTVELGG